MTTTERIVEAVIDYADYESQSDISIRIESLRTAIASVIGKERPKIDEIEKLKQIAHWISRRIERTEIEILESKLDVVKQVSKGGKVRAFKECLTVVNNHINKSAPPKDLTPKTDTTNGK